MSMSFGLNSTRNLTADNLQVTLTNIASIASTMTTFIGSYTIIRAKSRETRGHKYTQLLYHIVLYLSQFFVGTVLNLVILLPTPGIYSIGWFRNVTDECMIASLILFYFLFSFQGELLAILLLVEIQNVARKNALFKLPKIVNFVIISIFFLVNSVPHTIALLSSYISRQETIDYVSKSLPYHGFLLRYPFLWMVPSKKVYLSLAALVFCSTGIIVVTICIAYIIVLFELEIQVNTMSKKVVSAHKQLIDEVMLHGKVIFPFFTLIPGSVYAQFFVEEQADVSIPLAISFSLFVSVPIPAMLVFLRSNPTYRRFFIDIMLMNRRPGVVRVASVDSSREQFGNGVF